MRGLDVTIVRFLPFVLFGISGIDTYYCWMGLDIDDFYYFHSNSVIYALALFLISLSNKKYHCSYNRLCYVFLILTPLLNYLDAVFDLIPDVVLYLKIITYSYIFCAVGSIVLCVWHFIKVNSVRMKKADETIAQIEN